MKELYGYICVFGKEQNIDRQQTALEAFGVAGGNIFLDRPAKKNADRPAYRRLVQGMEPGDTLVIGSIDMLGRNYDEIAEQWQFLTGKKKASVVVLDMPLLDTRADADRSGAPVSDITLQVLRYVARTDREAARRRQAEGIEAAKARGVQFGRRPKERPKTFEAVFREWEHGFLSARQAAQLLGVAHKTFLKWAAKDMSGEK